MFETTDDIPAVIRHLQEMHDELAKMDNADLRWLCSNKSILRDAITILEGLQNV